MAARGSIEELLDILYTEIEEAKNAPFSSDRCVVERDRVLDMIDDVKAELPGELKRARDLLANRNDMINAAKQEADSLRKQAADTAQQMTSRETLVLRAQELSKEILLDTENRCQSLTRAISEYCDDTLRRLEESVADTYGEIKDRRAAFRNAVGAMSQDMQRNRREQYNAMAERSAEEEEAYYDEEGEELED